MPSRARLLPALALLLALLAAAVPAVQAQDPVQVALEAGEGSECEEGKSFCLLVTSGSVSDVAAGATVELTFRNPSDNGQSHNVHVTDLNAANQGQSTSAGAAFSDADTDTQTPGGSDTITFDVPSDVDGTYLWCTVGGHENGGMWLLGGAAADDQGSPDGNGSPGFTTLGALAAAGLALLAARPRA